MLLPLERGIVDRLLVCDHAGEPNQDYIYLALPHAIYARYSSICKFYHSINNATITSSHSTMRTMARGARARIKRGTRSSRKRFRAGGLPHMLLLGFDNHQCASHGSSSILQFTSKQMPCMASMLLITIGPKRLWGRKDRESYIGLNKAGN
jgi:hypothetical protein